MVLRPSSISKLVVFGFGLAIVPLVLVIVSVTLSIAHFAEQGQVSILRAVAMSDAANRMNNAVRSMERYGLQYTVLQDQALLVLYDQSFSEYQKASTQFAAAGPSPVDRSGCIIWLKIYPVPVSYYPWFPWRATGVLWQVISVGPAGSPKSAK